MQRPSTTALMILNAVVLTQPAHMLLFATAARVMRRWSQARLSRKWPSLVCTTVHVEYYAAEIDWVSCYSMYNSYPTAPPTAV